MEQENQFQTPQSRRLFPSNVTSVPLRNVAGQQRNRDVMSLYDNQQQNPARFLNQNFVSASTLNETVRDLQSTIAQRDEELENKLAARDTYLLQEVSKLFASMNINQSSQSDQSTRVPNVNVQSQSIQSQGVSMDYNDLDVDNIVGGDALQNAISRSRSGRNSNVEDQNQSSSPFNGQRIQRNVGSHQESPIKSMEFLFKSGVVQKHILRSSPETFRPWLKYINQVLEGLWLSPLTKINPYKMPKQDTWSTWDLKCLDSSRSYMSGLTDDCQNNKIFHEYKDDYGISHPISKKTPIDALNAMYLMVLIYWPSLVHVLHQLFTASIDPGTLPFLIPECVGSPVTIRSMYFGGILYHNHNSEYIVMMKVQSFQKRGSFQASINDPPETVLQKLRLVVQDINAMAINQDSEPISPSMLRMKFLEIMQDIPQYKQAIGVLNLSVKEDPNGNPIPLSLDEYTKKLQIIFLEAKESSFRQRVNLVQEEETNLAEMDQKFSSALVMAKDYSKSKSTQGTFGSTKGTSGSFGKGSSGTFKSPKYGSTKNKGPVPVCYSFRDKGTCTFGSNCKFSHEKPTTAFTIATQEELNEQYGANAVYQYRKEKKRRKFFGKAGNAKKMSNHRAKMRTYNSKYQGAHSSEVLEELHSEHEVQEDTQVNSAEVDQPSEDPFDLSTTDTDTDEEL